MLKPSSYYKFFVSAIFLIAIWLWWRPIFAGTATIDPILFSLGALQVHWYGLTMAAGIGLSLWASLRIALPQQKKITSEQFLEASVWIILAGLVGARLLFVLLKWPEYASQPDLIWRIDQGGLSLHGALLGGLVALIWYARYHKLSWLALADIAVVGLPLGQIVGRVGNFINQEAFGGPTDLPWKMYVSEANRPSGMEQFDYFHPTFLYESLLLFALYWLIIRKYTHNHAQGSMTVLYLSTYSLIRFVVEYFRIDSDHLGALTTAQWASLVIGLFAIIWYYLQSKRHHHDQ